VIWQILCQSVNQKLSMPKNKDKKSEEAIETQIADNEIKLNGEIEALKEKVKDNEDKYLRLFAEFENFRKRNAKERLDLIQNASSELIVNLLPVLDDLGRSLKASEKNIEGLKEGIELVYRKFNTILQNKGLEKLDAIHKEFDAELHEAVTQIPVQDEKLKGKIVDIIEDGYTLNQKVIRFAKVIIGN
jgi:molecular chaperone GrpE